MPMLLVYEALGMKSPRSLSILILEVLIEILIKQFCETALRQTLFLRIK